jgi:magnesium chelatase accessory protein
LAPILARTLFHNPAAVSIFAHRAAQRGAIESLLRGTGSSIDPSGVELYERLFRKRGHLEGAVALMSHWDLVALQRELPRVQAPVALIVGDRDRAVPPAAAETIRRSVRHVRIMKAQGLGHLAHEEAPALVSGMILAALEQAR